MPVQWAVAQQTQMSGRLLVAAVPDGEGVNEVTWLLTLKIVLALTFDEPGEKGE